MDLFEHLNNITLHKKELNVKDDKEMKSYNEYIINRFISMCELYTPLVNELNIYSVPKEMHQRYYMYALPKRKQFFKYIKKKNELNKDELKYIAHYLGISEREAEMYLPNMSKKIIDIIISKYKYGKNKKIKI